jgi:hypothetical protein
MGIHRWRHHSEWLKPPPALLPPADVPGLVLLLLAGIQAGWSAVGKKRDQESLKMNRKTLWSPGWLAVLAAVPLMTAIHIMFTWSARS